MTGSKSDDTAADEQSDAAPGDGGAQRTSRWPRRVVLATLVLVAIVAAAPTVISRTALGQTLLGFVAESLPPGTRIGGVDLSWLHPVGVRDVSYGDDEGRELHVREVRTDASLWAMLSARRPPRTLTFRGIDVAIDLDAPQPLPDFPAADDAPGDGTASDDRTPDIPNIIVERLSVSLRGGPLREAVALQVSRADVDVAADGAVGVTGRGELVAGDASAPLSLSLQTGRELQSGRGRLVVESLQPGGVLERLKEPPLRAEGSVDLTVNFEQPANGPVSIEFGLSGPAVRLQGAVPDAPAVTVNKLKLLSSARYDTDGRVVSVDSLKFGADLLRGNLSGTVSLADETEASLDGRVELLGPAVALAGLPAGVSLSAVRFEPLSVRTRGADLAMRGDVSWPQASAFGLASRDGRVTYSLTPDVASVTLANVPIGSGRAVGTYDVDLSGPTPRLRFAGGPVLRDVTLTEDLCRQWLRYVSPTMSRATDVSGTFGLTLAPLDTPLRGGVPLIAGQLDIAGASLRPGPLGDELLGSLQTLSSLGVGDGRLAEIAGRAGGRDLATLPPQAVPFATDANGVSHEGFTLQSGGVTVQTSGRVGFDDRLDVVALVALPEQWTRDRPVLTAMAGRPFAIPVTGTLDRPKLDRSAFKNLGKRAAGAAASGLIQRLLDR